MDGFHLGLIVNPLAGIGGAAALKDSDGVAEQALALGAAPRAAERTRQALEVLLPLRERLRFLTFPGPMGGDLLAEMGFHFEVIGELAGERTSAEDTRRAVTLLQDAGVALILFAGGDGTARDVAAVAREGQPVLGIPAGVKIHSGVYAVSPRAAGELARRLGRVPTDKEILAHIGLDERAYQDYLQAEACEAIESLDALLGEGLENLVDGESALEARVLRERMLAQALAQLSERERLVLTLYYQHELSLKEIALVLDVSDARVCQLSKQALNKACRYLSERS